MTAPNGRTLDVDPAVITAAADRVQALGERLRTALTAVELAGNPVPAGADEVSVRAADTLGRESDDLLSVVSDTIGTMRADASGLRGHAESYTRTDDANADLLSGVRLS